MAHASTRALLLATALQLGLAAGPWTTGAQAQGISKSESNAIQATVQRQFDAFERDDAAGAFALASSAIRSQFGSAEQFMAIVKKRYQAVYRHRVAFFTAAERVDGQVIQSVRLTDAEDRVWVALYRLAQEPNGQWRILGCELLETRSTST